MGLISTSTSQFGLLKIRCYSSTIASRCQNMQSLPRKCIVVWKRRRYEMEDFLLYRRRVRFFFMGFVRRPLKQWKAPPFLVRIRHVHYFRSRKRVYLNLQLCDIRTIRYGRQVSHFIYLSRFCAGCFLHSSLTKVPTRALYLALPVCNNDVLLEQVLGKNFKTSLSVSTLNRLS